jgi:CheY-like chemotaxis protein
MLTASDAVEDRVGGLMLGADDYLGKPFARPGRAVAAGAQPGRAGGGLDIAVESVDEAIGWLDTVAQAFADAEPGPVPPWAFNTFATLQSLHMHLARGLAGRGTPPHAEAVASRVVAILRGPFPWLL